MSYDYEKITKTHYQSDEVAQRYHSAYTGRLSLKTLRARLVAAREKLRVARFLKQVPHETVLDLPAGAGKLAEVFQRCAARVTACDISENMLAIAREVYRRLGYGRVEFQVCDAERAAQTLRAHYDVAVCLRLMHRVPATVKDEILRQLACCADYAIVSFGADSVYHRVRNYFRRKLLGGVAAPCQEPVRQTERRVAPFFEVVDRTWVCRFLSQEVIFLLRSRPEAPAAQRAGSFESARQ